MKTYEQLIFEIRLFEACDVVTASNPNDNNYSDIDDWGEF